jgi:hypothetical protein
MKTFVAQLTNGVEIAFKTMETMDEEKDFVSITKPCTIGMVPDKGPVILRWVPMVAEMCAKDARLCLRNVVMYAEATPEMADKIEELWKLSAEPVPQGRIHIPGGSVPSFEQWKNNQDKLRGT